MASRAYCPTCGASCPSNRSSCEVCGLKITPNRPNPAYDSLSDVREKAVVFDINMTLLNTSERHRSALRAGLEDKNGNAVKKKTIEPLSKAQNRLNDFLHEDKHLSKDTVVPGAKTLVDHFAADGYTIVYCTNRPMKYKEATRRQLESKNFPIYTDRKGDPLLFLRSGSGSKQSYKRDILVELRATYDVHYVFDDSNKVLNEAAQLGIPGLYTTVQAYLDIIKPSNTKKNPIEHDREGKAFVVGEEDPEKAAEELAEYYDAQDNPSKDDEDDEDDEDASVDGTKFGLTPGDVEQHREFLDTAAIDPSFREFVGKMADKEDQTYYIIRKDTEGKTGLRISSKLPDSEDSGTLIDVVEPDEYSHLDKFQEEHNPRANPVNPSKVEKGKKLYEHMNKSKPAKIETKQIDIGDVWYQVGEGGCWQIGYMSGKETKKKDQKYTHLFNEETKDGNFPKLYATIPDKGKPMLIITGGTWKIKTDDTNTAWIYD